MKFPPKATSQVRSRLQECHAARQDAEAKIAETNASLARLANHENEVAEAERKLALLDSAEASATLEWAKSGDGAAPSPNVESREEIGKALASARAQAAAAVRARASLSAELETALKPLHGIQAWSSVAIAQIVCEEAAPLLADMIDAQQSLAAKMERIGLMREFALAAAERLPKGSEEARVIYVAAEALANNIQRAMAANDAPLDASVATRAALSEFVAALSDDSTVALAGAK
ncbi:MAG TPA: hypothetical protein VFE60_28320 [Roseiarcus sp.]|jgi:hypothetical protein|nr:hypothetical protein [Roseiarcus sp.]